MLNKEEIIKRSNEIHGNKYSYESIEYINSRKKMNIICHIHGPFKQTPANHIYLKQGCPECANRKKLTTEEFIKKSKLIHGNKYDYSLVDYKNNFTNVKIICPNHGVFEQKPNRHLVQRSGCSKCGGKNKKTTDEFISLAKKIHGDIYDYSLVKYISGHSKVKIICDKHWIFEQTPNLHTNRKHGCPFCKKSVGENIITKALKENNFEFIPQKEFENCRDKRRLSFDFFLPEYNICIEYDGLQHFESVDLWGGIDNLKYTQDHDKIKTDYCNNNDIKLIRIKYDRKLKSEDILQKIENVL